MATLLSEKLWLNAIEEYRGQEFKIELSNLVMTISFFDEKRLQKHFLYSRSKLGKVAQILKSEDALTIEQNNRAIADYINQQLHEYLKLPLPQKKSFLKQLQEE